MFSAGQVVIQNGGSGNEVLNGILGLYDGIVSPDRRIANYSVIVQNTGSVTLTVGGNSFSAGGSPGNAGYVLPPDKATPVLRFAGETFYIGCPAGPNGEVSILLWFN